MATNYKRKAPDFDPQPIRDKYNMVRGKYGWNIPITEFKWILREWKEGKESCRKEDCSMI